jgi:hypothetical protein
VPRILLALLPAVAGGVVGSLGMVGLVWSQTQAPETNPASQPALVYGD